MLKRPLLIFTILTAILVGSAVGFLQSRTFAGMVQGFLSKSIPSELGVRGNFEDFGIRLFPPAVSIRKPELKLEPKNLFSLPADSVIRAERIDLRFRPIQMLTGRVLLDQLRIVGGDIELQLAGDRGRPAQPRAKSHPLDWDSLVQVQVLGLALEDSRISLEWEDRDLRVEVDARQIALSRQDDSRSKSLLLDSNISSLVIVEGEETRQVTDLSLVASISPDGIDIQKLAADFGGEDFEFLVSSSGRIHGSILDLESLKADLAIQAEGELESLAGWVGLSGESGDGDEERSLSGRTRFDGRIRADLLKFEQTLVFDGKIRLEEGEVLGWSTSLVEAAARLEAQGKLSHANLAIRSATIGFSSGGSVQVGAFEMRIGQQGAVKIPIQLKQAVLGELLGPYADLTSNLQVDWTGGLDLEITPSPSRWSVHARADLKASKLDLHGKGEPHRTNLILRALSPTIRGGFLVQPGKFVPEGLELGFERSRFSVGGGITWKSKGPKNELLWDLVAEGPTDLTDLESLGGSKIAGKGNLRAQIRGPGENLELNFDADLEEAEYIQLKFGMLRGRFSLTDEMQKLTFHSVHGKSGSTPYVISGPIDFKGDGRMALSYDFPSGRVEDFLKVFGSLTSRLSWFPQSLKGRLRSRGTVGGTLSVAGMEIATQIEGGDWTLMGERLRAVKFRGGLTHGRYWAEDLVAIKRSGSLLGKVSYSADNRLSWSIKSQNFSLRDLDWVIRVDVPISGEVTLQSEGAGRLDQLDSRSLIRIRRAAVRGQTLADSELLVQTQQGAIRVDGTGLGGQARIMATHDPRAGSSNSLSLRFSNCDFSSLLALLNPGSAQESELGAKVSGGVELQYRGDQMEQSSGRIELSEFWTSKKGARFSLARPVSATISAGTFSIPDLQIRSDSGQSTQLRLGAEQGLWKTEIGGALDLSFIEFLTPFVVQAKGAVDLDFTLGGRFDEPVFTGKGEVRGGFLRVPGLDSPLENVVGRINVRQGKWSFSGFNADLAQGRVQGGGQIQLFTDRFPQMDLSVQLADNRIKAYPFQFIKLKSGKLRISGEQFPYDITGALVIEQGLSREKLANSGNGIALKSSMYAPPVSAEGSVDFPKFKLKIDASADQGLRFQNEFLDVEMKAQVSVVNTINAPRILGKAELVPGQGKLSFKEHVFQIQNATVTFDNPTVINPRFDVGATTEISGTKVQLYASGTGDKYKIDLSSNPVMPESEILSLLALGRTSEESQKMRSANVSGMQQSEAASLILHSMDFNRDVKEKTGFQIGLGEASDNSSGSSIFRPQADAESTVAPKIVLKRKIGKRIDVSVGTTVGAGATSQKEVNADLYLSPSVSVRGVWNYLEGTTTQDAGASQQGRTSYGLDLKLQKRFK